MRRPGVLVWLAVVACSRLPAADDGASIDGVVLSDTTGQLLKRAEILLRGMEARLASTGVETDDKGHFLLTGIPPGRYQFSAERDGYLPSSAARHGALRMPAIVTLGADDHLRDVSFRLRPWAVVGGRVKYDDGEPAVNILVRLYREFHLHGHRGYSAAGQARTNDRGEYRVHGLSRGSYYIAAIYDRSPAANVIEQPRRDEQGRILPEIGYTTTFYPSATRLIETSPIHLDYGQEIDGMDVFLTPVRRVALSGRVTSGISGRAIPTPAITLERVDLQNTGGLPLPVTPSYDSDGSFTIRSVPPGAYILLLASSDDDKLIQARVALTVGEADIDDLDAVLEPPRTAIGTVRVEGARKSSWPKLHLSFEPRSESGAPVRAGVEGGSFTASLAAGETYDLFVENLPTDAYVKSIHIANLDAKARGIPADQVGPATPIEVAIGTPGASVSGRAFNEAGDMASGANVSLVPTRPAGHLQDYRMALADEYGSFQITGVAPGRYLLFAWFDEMPCDVFDSESLGTCEAKAVEVTVADGDQLTEGVQMKK